MKSGKIVFELDRRDRAARAALIIVIVSVHLLLIVWLAGSRIPVSANGPKAVAVVGLLPGLDPGRPERKSAKASRATPQERHSIIELPPLPSLDLATMSFEAAESAGDGGGGCALTEQLRTAILADPAAMAELASLPAGIRSDADAVMLWNGQWFQPGPQPDPSATAPMRALIEKLVATASNECRNMTWTGPQFIPISEGQRYTMLVIGSGAWRWQDLIEPPANCAVGQFPGCAPEPARLGSQPTN